MRAVAHSLTVALIVVLASVPSRAEDRMLAHDVYFSLKDNSPQAKEKLIAACKKYLSNHPGTVWFAVGPLADELKRDVNDLDFDVALHLVFKNKAAHDVYQKAERHLTFIEENKDTWKKVRVFDSYEAFAHGTVESKPGGQAGLLNAVTGYWGVAARAKVNASRAQIGLFKVSLDLYKLDVGEYPTTEQGLRALIEAPKALAEPAKWDGPYLEKEVPLDPWKRPYRYRYPGKHAPDQPDIWSSGPDGIDGTKDDIGSWEKR